MKSLIMCALTSFALISSCDFLSNSIKKAESQLPPATQTGADTFGFYVNDQLWSRDGKFCFYSVGYEPSGDYYFMFRSEKTTLTNGGQVDEFFDILAVGIKEEGTYVLNKDRAFYSKFIDDVTVCDTSYDSAKVNCAGKLYITKLDIPNRIISGTFEATITKEGCDTIKITQGRFDDRL